MIYFPTNSTPDIYQQTSDNRPLTPIPRLALLHYHLPHDHQSYQPGILATMELEKQLQTSVLGSVLGPGGSGPLGTAAKKISMESEEERAVRKTWAAVLKDCHKCDPQGLGCVSREDFLMALSNGMYHVFTILSCDTPYPYFPFLYYLTTNPLHTFQWHNFSMLSHVHLSILHTILFSNDTPRFGTKHTSLLHRLRTYIVLPFITCLSHCSLFHHCNVVVVVVVVCLLLQVH